MHIVIVGLMATGKTPVGERLAELLGRPLWDGDHELERRTGFTPAQVAARRGIARLHELEAAVLLDLLTGEQPAVVVPASSTIEDARCRSALSRTFVVWLRAGVPFLVTRVRDSRHRPLHGDIERQLEEQMAARHPLFERVADVVIDIEGRTASELAALVAASAAPSG